MRKFTAYGEEYSVSRVTAIAYCDGCDEAKRQDALMVVNERFGEEASYVVFGYEMPETEDDFINMYTESGAWEMTEDAHMVEYVNEA